MTHPVNLHSVSSWLLSFGLVFSVATQLRLPGLPLGFGEILLLSWLLTTFVFTPSWRNPALAAVLLFTLVGASLLGAGYFLTAYPFGQPRPPALHDVLAYVFCVILAANYIRLPDEYKSDLPIRLLWAFLFSALLALVLGVVGRDWSGVDAMYYGERWQHLSNNPNQFALLALPLPYLALHVLLQQPEKHKLLAPTLLGLLALALGFFSKSDALLLAWIGGGLVAAFALFGKRPKNPTPSSATALLPRARLFAAFLLFVMVVGSAWQFRDVVKQTSQAAQNCNVEGGEPTAPSIAEQSQVGVRFCLWRNAVMAIQYAPLTGLGPGPHSGIVKPFEGEEAHNTLLDWGTQTGLVGAVGLIVYLTWLLWRVARYLHYVLVGMVLALFGFAMFHFMLRHPFFWIVPLMALGLASAPGRTIFQQETR